MGACSRRSPEGDRKALWNYANDPFRKEVNPAYLKIQTSKSTALPDHQRRTRRCIHAPLQVVYEVVQVAAEVLFHLQRVHDGHVEHLALPHADDLIGNAVAQQTNRKVA